MSGGGWVWVYLRVLTIWSMTDVSDIENGVFYAEAKLFSVRTSTPRNVTSQYLREETCTNNLPVRIFSPDTRRAVEMYAYTEWLKRDDRSRSKVICTFNDFWVLPDFEEETGLTSDQSWRGRTILRKNISEVVKL